MEDDDVPPISPIRVGLLILFLAGVAFGAYRLYQENRAVTAVAEASKDYRKLFPARGQEQPEPEIPQNAPLSAVPQSGMMLKIDDDMRPPAPAPKETPPAEAKTEPAPVAAAPAPAPAAAPAKPQPKTFNQPRLNQGAYSRLGGTGIGMSGSNMGGGAAVAAPAGKAGAAPPAGMPDISTLLPAVEAKK